MKNGKFCYINTDSMEKHGIVFGDQVYVAGDYKEVMDEDTDRVVYVCAKVDGDGHIITSEKAFTALSDQLMEEDRETQGKYNKIKLEDFGKSEGGREG